MDLKDIRKEIDSIDKEIINLLCRRMDISRSVAEFKTENNIPVLNTQREEEIIEKVKKTGNDYDTQYGDLLSIIYSTVMDGSRALQYGYMDTGKELKKKISSALTFLETKSKIKVACQGVKGSYSHRASRKLFKNTEPIFVSSFYNVFESVNKGEVDYGILPIENSAAGSVDEVYDLVMQYRFSIVSATEIPVRHCLLAKAGVKLGDIKEVYSHEQAINQSSEFFSRYGFTQKYSSNTAVAAKMVSESDRNDIAAIASQETAEIYGLEILKEDIQNMENNCTRFIAISKNLIIPKDANKISLMFALPHVTGSLYRMLSRFAMTGLNLTKLESRPLREAQEDRKTFTYIFYLDFEGSLRNKGVLELLADFSEETPKFAFLGHYREG